MKLAASLWNDFGSLRLAEVPERARVVAGQCVLDWLACALAGSREPLSEILRDELGGGAGPATLVGTAETASALTAALVNGAAGHALDFDDTHTKMGGHPTVPVLPAALALAQERGASGAELLAAFIVGVEVESRIGALFGGQTYARGWHCTSTHGVFGAAAAACHLLGATTEQFGNALGLAASQASGVKINFGTMTKPFHAGHAAERGLLSAKLACRGFTASPEAVEGRQGLADASANGGSELRWDELEKARGRYLVEDTLFKYHAACYLTHSAIESVDRLKREIGTRRLSANDVERAVVTVHPALLDVCGIARPKTGLEAKFSLTATTALAALGRDTTDTATFVDSTLRDAELQKLIERVEIATDEGLRHTRANVELASDGRRFEASHDSGVPATDLVEQGDKLRAKFAGLAVPILGDEAEALASTALGLGDVASVRRLGAARESRLTH